MEWHRPCVRVLEKRLCHHVRCLSSDKQGSLLTDGLCGGPVEGVAVVDGAVEGYKVY